MLRTGSPARAAPPETASVTISDAPLERESQARPLSRSGRRDVIDPVQAAAAPEAAALGRLADSPLDIPWRGWKRVLRRAVQEMISDQVPLVAAGCAFYATLALFPAISILVSIYGLAFDPVTVAPHLQVLQDLIPSSVFELFAQRVHELVTKPHRTLTLGLAVSVGITLWSSTIGTKSILSALNLAYEERERRSVLRFQATALTMTLLAILGAALGLALLVALRPALAFLGFTRDAAGLVRAASTGALVVFVGASLSLLYRFGPCRRPARWRWVAPGALLATLLWLVASALFSFYVGRLSTYDAMYGSLGAVAGVMVWFYVTAYVVLLGAELNAELELQTVRDSTGGPPRPIGRRGAYVADHVARD